jgi:hypothetical protein
VTRPEKEGRMDAYEQERAVDLDARYAVAGYGGVAFYLQGYAKEWTEESWQYDGDDRESTDEYEPRDDPANYVYNEPEEVEDRSMVRAVMVGDDYVHIVDVDDLTLIADDDYCAECGQIGCTADGRPRD